jgi:S-(hydroxymethyl)glutathione dehydrogenase/alcohol dehydrogenase
MLELHRSGKLKLEELRTSTYSLDDINTGYDDMAAGTNIRGVILHD